jgi:hypothetical protein
MGKYTKKIVDTTYFTDTVGRNIEKDNTVIIDFIDRDRFVTKIDPPLFTEKLKTKKGRLYSSWSTVELSLRNYATTLTDVSKNAITTTIQDETVTTVTNAHKSDIPFKSCRETKEITDDSYSTSTDGYDVVTGDFTVVRVAHNPAISFISSSNVDSPFSFSITAKTSNITTNSTIFSKGTVLGAGLEYKLEIIDEGKIKVSMFYSGQSDLAESLTITSDSISLVNNRWTTISFRYLGHDWSSAPASYDKLFSLYVNNKKVDATVSAGLYNGMNSSGHDLLIGATDISSTNVEDYSSILFADFTIWSSAITIHDVVGIHDAIFGKETLYLKTKIYDNAAVQGPSVSNNVSYGKQILPTLSSADSFSLDKESFKFAKNQLGLSKGFKDGVPFNDMNGNFNPIAYLNNDRYTEQWPIVFDENIIDPAILNGVIEPLAIRRTIGNMDIDSPFHAHSIRASMMSGKTTREFGTSVVTGDIKIKENNSTDGIINNIMLNNDPFFDAQEVSFDSVIDSATGTTIIFPVPGFLSDVPQQEIIFDDTVDLTANDELSDAYNTIMYDRDRDRFNQEIKSATSGFVYSNNPEGTDSLAFGGLLRN